MLARLACVSTKCYYYDISPCVSCSSSRHLNYYCYCVHCRRRRSVDILILAASFLRLLSSISLLLRCCLLLVTKESRGRFWARLHTYIPIAFALPFRITRTYIHRDPCSSPVLRFSGSPQSVIIALPNSELGLFRLQFAHPSLLSSCLLVFRAIHQLQSCDCY